jgi:enoyl-CoA hydratase/carnithine racemase
MSDSSALLITQHDAIRVISINRPERRNSLNLQDRRELADAIIDADNDRSCRGIVLTGEGKVFCAGGDISSMTGDEEVARERLVLANVLATSIVHASKPVIAAVRGGAYGLGLAVVQACDFVIAANDARFTASFAKLGLGPDTGLAWSLAQRVGSVKAKQLILQAREVSAPEALAMGMVDQLVNADDVLSTAIELAQVQAAFSMPMVAATKAIFAQEKSDLAAVLSAEMEVQVKLLAGKDFAEGSSAFFEKRSAKFSE